jgi:hypothetical protein
MQVHLLDRGHRLTLDAFPVKELPLPRRIKITRSRQDQDHARDSCGTNTCTAA